jgi:hypothetical protein
MSLLPKTFPRSPHSLFRWSFPDEQSEVVRASEKGFTMTGLELRLARPGPAASLYLGICPGGQIAPDSQRLRQIVALV